MSRSEPRVYRLAGAFLAVVVLAGVIAAIAATPGSSTKGDRWSAPAMLDACADATPAVAFPADSPAHGTGPGAIVWSVGRSCGNGAGAHIAELGAADDPRAVESLPAPRPATGAQATVTGASEGRLFLSSDGALRETGPSGAPATQLAAAAPGAPIALATAYRGQAVALYAPWSTSRARSEGQLVLRREPFLDGDDASTSVVSGPHPGRIEALAVALDYRTDAIAAWLQGGYLYARSLPHTGPRPPARRLTHIEGHPQLAALISDDGRAILAWSEREGDHTSVYAEITEPGIRFVAPRLLERFRDPGGAPPPEGSLRLARLSSGRVLLAWPGASGGRYVVRLAHVSVGGVQAPRTIAAGDRGGDAVLADLTPGPRGDALVLWNDANARAGRQLNRSIFAAYATLSPAGVPLLGSAERVAPSGAVGGPVAAFDPDSDRAIAVWRTARGVSYAVREAHPWGAT